MTWLETLAVLGIAPGDERASDGGIDEGVLRRAYRKRALALHPDKNPDSKNAVDDFNRLTDALENALEDLRSGSGVRVGVRVGVGVGFGYNEKAEREKARLAAILRAREEQSISAAKAFGVATASRVRARTQAQNWAAAAFGSRREERTGQSPGQGQGPGQEQIRRVRNLASKYLGRSTEKGEDVEYDSRGFLGRKETRLRGEGRRQFIRILVDLEGDGGELGWEAGLGGDGCRGRESEKGQSLLETLLALLEGLFRKFPGAKLGELQCDTRGNLHRIDLIFDSRKLALEAAMALAADPACDRLRLSSRLITKTAPTPISLDPDVEDGDAGNVSGGARTAEPAPVQRQTRFSERPPQDLAPAGGGAVGGAVGGGVGMRTGADKLPAWLLRQMAQKKAAKTMTPHEVAEMENQVFSLLDFFQFYEGHQGQ